jgi:hypothetical protein
LSKLEKSKIRAKNHIHLNAIAIPDGFFCRVSRAMRAQNKKAAL